jgi:putative membrane protein
MNWFMAFLHHLAAFTLVASLAYEFLLLRKPLTLESARALLTSDRIYGISAVLLLLLGGLRVFYFEKGTHYYFHSAPFIAKLTLFALIGVISTYPTSTFLSWRKSLTNNSLPVIEEKTWCKLQKMVRLELIGVAAILLAAAMAAKGIGYLS